MTFSRRLLCDLVLLFVCQAALAQTTKVRGQVLDYSDGKPIPFASVFFVGSEVGISTDIDGNFSLSTRDMNLERLRATMLSYESQDIRISRGIFNEVVFLLKRQENVLSSATVKADNSRAKRLLENIDAHRQANNPEARPGYSCDVYSKLELDITHPQEQLKTRSFRNSLKFIFDYVDTSEISGVPYLPVLINETVSRRYHRSNPLLDREVVSATQLSGAEPEGNMLTQFTGSLHLKNNFYEDYINTMNVEIPSPIQSSGLLFYNYYIIDSLQLDGRNTYRVRYHPKPSISTPSFDGEMLIDAQDFAIRRIRAKMMKGQNINWIRDMVIEGEYVRMEDSSWFYKSERFYADFSLVMSDSSKLMSFIGNRTLEFSNPDYTVPDISGGQNVVEVKEGSSAKDSTFWDASRPYKLSRKEKNIYAMVDRIQDTRWYQNAYTIVETIINGYWDIGKFGIGPYHKIVSFNPLEGFRLGIGGHTSHNFSKKDRFSAYVAFGFKDLEVKGGGTYEHMFGKEPTRKLTLNAKYDVLQLGRGSSPFTTDNLLASIFGAGKSQKLCMVIEASALYDHELNSRVNNSNLLMYREYHSNSYVPMLTPQGIDISRVPSLEGRVDFRFSKDETVNRGPFKKLYVHTKHPVFTLSLGGGCGALNGIAGMDDPLYGSSAGFAYFRPELSIDWKLRIPPIGTSKLHLNTGTIVGRVPYTHLHLHEGNGTLIFDKTAFSCMNFFEFASDSWVTFMWDHNFQGFFLGKIPWVKKLQLREAFLFKLAWGHLSEKNDGSWTPAEDGGGVASSPDASQSKAMLLFPEGTSSLGNMPYMEMGFGITNIFRLFRIDFVWRLTHREDVRSNPRNFTVNVGIELKF